MSSPLPKWWRSNMPHLGDSFEGLEEWVKNSESHNTMHCSAESEIVIWTSTCRAGQMSWGGMWANMLKWPIIVKIKKILKPVCVSGSKRQKALISTLVHAFNRLLCNTNLSQDWHNWWKSDTWFVTAAHKERPSPFLSAQSIRRQLEKYI